MTKQQDEKHTDEDVFFSYFYYLFIEQGEKKNKNGCVLCRCTISANVWLGQGKEKKIRSIVIRIG
jgi:hypothetical protein